MSLAAGTKLGPYEILAPLGAGGMGDVYRARDSQLGRDVAIKLVNDALAQDAENMARFEREARLLAAVNHPNIAAIYGIEERSGTRFLVLELVEGEPLDAMLASGPLGVTPALEIGRQVADALSAAHEKGVVHRDLKPSNVLVTSSGRVKVLDFGLAKDVEEQAAAGSKVVTSPAMTAAGTILGTPAYMSPEQARGKPVDRRTDLWSFGCVLYEMLCGRRSFGGDTVTDCLAAIVEREPNWAALPRATPAPIRRLLRHCLEKDPERRLRDAGDARLEIEESLAPARRSRDWRWLGAMALAAAVAGAVFLVARRPSAGRAPTPKLSQVTSAEGIEDFPAWSPDGRSIAYAGEAGGVRKIFLKRLGEGEGTMLTAKNGFDDIQPAWTPDGKTVAFVRAREQGRRLEPGDVFGQYNGGDVWTVDVATGKESRLLEEAANPSFSPDGRLAVDAEWVGPQRIWITDASGHNPQQATTDVSEAVAHVRPRWSPDGKRIVFQNIERTKFDVRVVDLASKQLTWVTNDLPRDVQPVWSPSGRFIYFSSDRAGGLNLWRVAVSAEGAPQGPPQQLTTGAGQDIDAAVSRDGKRLAFAILKQNADLWVLPLDPSSGRPSGAPRELVATTREDSRGAWSPDGKRVAFNSDRDGEMNIWVRDLGDGSTKPLTRGPGGDYQANWSPDGKSIVFFSSRSGSANIWKADVASGALTPLTNDASIDVNPFYSPDGKWIAFQSDRSGRLEVWVMGADGSAPRQLTRTGVSGHFLRWTADGSGVVFRCPCGGKSQTMKVGLEGGDPQPTAEVAGGAHMSFSPDGSSIIDVVGHKTVWVSPLGGGKPSQVFAFDDPDSRIDYPVWSPDGKELLFDRFRPQGGDIWLMEDFE
ncbi:MAG TPA: protein kinase [Thermoanaerobaculia bacterium]|nr:protein kinase [Thermoanaerobaculia bacterium]